MFNVTVDAAVFDGKPERIALARVLVTQFKRRNPSSPEVESFPEDISTAEGQPLADALSAVLKFRQQRQFLNHANQMRDDAPNKVVAAYRSLDTSGKTAVRSALQTELDRIAAE
jgi:hypothetical protein